VPWVFARQLFVMGSPVFAKHDLEAVTAMYVNRHGTREVQEALRLALTRLCINAGSVHFGAILRDQTVTAGVITLHCMA
jgi:hypothetical protein